MGGSYLYTELTTHVLGVCMYLCRPDGDLDPESTEFDLFCLFRFLLLFFLVDLFHLSQRLFGYLCFWPPFQSLWSVLATRLMHSCGFCFSVWLAFHVIPFLILFVPTAVLISRANRTFAGRVAQSGLRDHFVRTASEVTFV